jgi:hypothetical protein
VWPSFSAVPIASQFHRVLKDIAAVLRRRGDSWLVFGAQAVAMWSVPRLTDDVDVTVRIAAGTPRDLVEDLTESGFTLRVSDIEGFLDRTHVVPLLHAETGIEVDVVLALSGLENEFLRRAQNIDVDGEPIPFISAEDLVIAKILAGRPKDSEDVRAILRTRLSQLDLGRIRTLLRSLEQALDQSDLLTTLEELVRQSRRS